MFVKLIRIYNEIYGNNMKNGILVIKKFIQYTIQELYLPIFHEDRDFVNSVLSDAMIMWKRYEKTNSQDDNNREYFIIADAIGRERLKSDLFIGFESIPYEKPESIINHASYVFRVDFENQKIVTLK